MWPRVLALCMALSCAAARAFLIDAIPGVVLSAA